MNFLRGLIWAIFHPRQYWAKVQEIRAMMTEQGMAFLQCNSPGCKHVEFHKVLTQEHVNKPCPRCGANLMTPEEFRDHCEGNSRQYEV